MSHSNYIINFDDSNLSKQLLIAFIHAHSAGVIEKVLLDLGNDFDNEVIGNNIVKLLWYQVNSALGRKISGTTKRALLTSFIENLTINKSKISKTQLDYVSNTEIKIDNTLLKECARTILRLYKKGQSVYGLVGITPTSIIIEVIDYKPSSSTINHKNKPHKQSPDYDVIFS